MPETPGVAIIGAGASGIATAHYLKKAGYDRVTIFEKMDRIGGKCLTFEADGKLFDLGANYITPHYTEVLGIAASLGLKSRPAPSRKSFDLNTGKYLSTMSTTLMGKSRLAFGAASMKYLYLASKYRNEVTWPGFSKLEQCPELCRPFGEWLDLNGLSILRQLFLIPVTIFGYGPLDEVPTPYVLKYMDFRNFMLLAKVGAGLSKEWPRHFEDGYQGFLDALARRDGMDIRLSSQIVSISRSPAVRVELADGSAHEFDKLVLACPLDSILPLLSDATEEEKSLLPRIKYRNYFVSACRVEGMPDITTDEIQMPPAEPLPPIGHPWGVVKFWEGSDVNLFFSVAERRHDSGGSAGQDASAAGTDSVGEPPIDGDTVVKWIKQDVSKRGGEDKALITQQHWTTFFPHVEAADLADGFYTRLENHQGESSTYYVGGIVALELVEPIFNYSKALVERHFVAQRPGLR
jgi:hypothetical protein